MIGYNWRKPGIINFGDELAGPILAAIAGRPVPMIHEPIRRAKVLSVGSVLHLARADDVVWGSGLRRSDDAAAVPKVDIRAVRGPRTACHLKAAGHDVPDVYGDPARLLPRLFPMRVGGNGVGYVPHFADRWAGIPPGRIIDVRQSALAVVAAIAACDWVVSGSLHGIIVAEAYGVPAVLAHTIELKRAGPFKYQDYYESTGRTMPVPADPVVCCRRDAARPPLDDPARLDELMAAFPRDLLTDEQEGGAL